MWKLADVEIVSARSTSYLGLAVIAASVLNADSASAQAPPKAPDGKAIYNLRCATCHGRAGKAPPAYAKKGTPDLADPDWQSMRKDAEIRELIEKGSEGTEMKPFKGELSPAEIEAVVRRVRTFKPVK